MLNKPVLEIILFKHAWFSQTKLHIKFSKLSLQLCCYTEKVWCNFQYITHNSSIFVLPCAQQMGVGPLGRHNSRSPALDTTSETQIWSERWMQSLLDHTCPFERQICVQYNNAQHPVTNLLTVYCST